VEAHLGAFTAVANLHPVSRGFTRDRGFLIVPGTVGTEGMGDGEGITITGFVVTSPGIWPSSVWAWMGACLTHRKMTMNFLKVRIAALAAVF